MNPFDAVTDDALLPVLAGVIFLVVLIAGLVIFSPLFDYARHRRRVSQVDQFGLPGATPSAEPAGENPLAQAALAVSARLVRAGGSSGQIAERLDRAGMRIRPNEWVLWRIVVCFVGGVLFYLLLPPLGLVIGALLGFAATALYRRVRTERRYQAFANHLPDSFQLVVGSLRAGFSLGQAIDAMTRESPEPVATEFNRALAETRLGADLEDALARLAIRMRSRDLEWVVVAIRIQKEVGGNLAEVIGTNIDTMRERESLRRHIRALSAEGRLSAYVIAALPPLVILMMLVLRREYIMPLFNTAAGLFALLLAGLLMGLGSLIMWRIVKVEV
jgi:Flp pilus assembly protein TadB